MMNSRSKTIVIFSSCLVSWGGSEELWSQTAEVLASQGYKIHIFKLNVNFGHPQIKKLMDLGCIVTDLDKYLPNLVRRIGVKLLPNSPKRNLRHYIKKYLAQQIDEIKPDLFIISQGDNFDGLPFIQYCDLSKYRYVIISQKATDFLWADDYQRKWMTKVWENSATNFFVSKENLRLTEEQFGISLNNSEVVRNPFLTKVEKPLNWSFKRNEPIRLACVARLFAWDKGQDILLRVLAKEKWQQRNIHVSFFGEGVNSEGLQGLANYLGVKNVSFEGQVSDIISIWKNHQALILPSRNEGLPLVLVEAMMCGRAAIVTNIGGNAEVLEDNLTGFIAQSIDEKGIDEAMERAWQRLDEWESIGELAAKKVRMIIPQDPPAVFAEKLDEIIVEQREPVKSGLRDLVNKEISF